MGTRSAVAVRQNDGTWKGRYTHWDGYPNGVGQEVKDLIARDGRDKVIAVLTEENYGWSSLDADQKDEPLSPGYDDGRFRTVVGYGVAYTTEQNQSRPEWWIASTDEDKGWIEWAHVIEPDGSVTHYHCNDWDTPIDPEKEN